MESKLTTEKKRPAAAGVPPGVFGRPTPPLRLADREPAPTPSGPSAQMAAAGAEPSAQAGFELSNVPILPQNAPAGGAVPDPAAAPSPAASLSTRELANLGSAVQPLLGTRVLSELLRLIDADAAASAFVAEKRAPAILALDATRSDSQLDVERARLILRQAPQDFEPAALQSVQRQLSQPSDPARLVAVPTLMRYLPAQSSFAMVYTLDASAFAERFANSRIPPRQRGDAKLRAGLISRARSIGGQYERQNNAIILNAARADLTAVIHEYVHSFASDEFARQSSPALEEGTTQYFAQKVASEISSQAAIDLSFSFAYPEETLIANLIAHPQGVGEEILGQAYFLSSWSQLVAEFDKRFGAGAFMQMERLLRSGGARAVDSVIQMLQTRLQIGAPTVPVKGRAK